MGGGLWPPPVVLPQRKATTPDPGKSMVIFICHSHFWRGREGKARERGVGGRGKMGNVCFTFQRLKCI